MAGKELTEQEKREIEAFGSMAGGLEARRKELLAEAHKRAELELHQYRVKTFDMLEKLSKKYSTTQIVKLSGLARSTVYRWLERAKHERIMAEAIAKGIDVESLSGLGGFGNVARDSLAPASAPIEPEPKTPEELGWHSPKRTISGEIGATDANGHIWLFSEDGEAWNKTENVRIDIEANWPEGAKELVDSLRQ